MNSIFDYICLCSVVGFEHKGQRLISIALSAGIYITLWRKLWYFEMKERGS